MSTTLETSSAAKSRSHGYDMSEVRTYLTLNRNAEGMFHVR